MLSRVFTDQDLREEARFVLEGADFHHLKNVLRMKPGDQFRVVDRTTADYLLEISSLKDERFICEILERRENRTELPLKIILCQALAKGDKMDTLIRQSVELGIFKIFAFASDHAQVRLSGAKLQKRLEHWQNVAEAAAKQSGRGLIPELCYAASTEEMIEFMRNRDAAFVPYEGERALLLREYLRRTLPDLEGREEASLAFAIGPEGGYSARETELLREAEIPLVSLGPRILRTETAGPAVQAVLASALDLPSEELA